MIDIIAKAQQEDGYLDTYFTIKEPEHRWKNLLEGHELYCIEGVDNGPQLQALILPRDSRITEHRETEGVLAGTVTLKAVPYYIWGNRGTGQMRVWIRE